MVQAYLMSFCLQQYLTRREAFVARYLNDWLIWEPGHWTSTPYDEGTVAPAKKSKDPIDVSAAMAKGTALCFELKPLVPDRPIRVGRGDTNDLVINDGTVSREHMELQWRADEKRWLAAAVGTGKATRHRGVALSGQVPLRDGDTLSLGEITLTYYGSAGFWRRLQREIEKQLGPRPSSA